MDTLLVALVLLPAVGAALAAAASDRSSRLVAAGVAVLELVLALWLVAKVGDAQFSVPWIPSLGIAFHLGLDGLNALLVVLAALLTSVALFATPPEVPRLREYSFWMLLLLAGMQGVFLSQNLGCFYVFWEVMLIPAWLLVGRWGSDRTGRVPMKFFLYTLAGSLAMLLAVVALAFTVSSTPDLSFTTLVSQVGTGPLPQGLLVLFALGFLVKVPLFPLHGWLPETYEAAPAPVTAVVAGVMSKAGVYGLMKVGLGVFGQVLPFLAPTLAALSLFTILYGAACALGARRLRQVLAYSSLSHMGMMMLGFASLQTGGLAGVSLQMFNHGLTTGGLFLLAGMLEARGISGRFEATGGLARRMPRFAAVFLFVAMGSLGLPGLCSYPGELLILNGAWRTDPTWALVGGLGVVAAGWYTLRLYQALMHGPLSDQDEAAVDFGWWQLSPLVPLMVLILWIGLYPGPMVDMARTAIENFPGFTGLAGGL